MDLGASQTVIGHEQLKELLEQLPEEVRKQVRKTTCNLLFRFGNHQTLESRTAVLIPMQGARFRIAVVHGKTPFLISSQLKIKGTLWSTTLKRHLKMEPTKKNLFLLDINQFWQPLEESSFLQMQEHSCTSRQVQQSNPTDQNPLPTPAKHDSPAAANSSEAESVVIGRRNLSNQENTREARTTEAALKEVDVPLTGQPSSSNESSSPIVQAQSVDHHAFRPLRSVVPTPEVHGERGNGKGPSGIPDSPSGADGPPQDPIWQGKARYDLRKGLQRPGMDQVRDIQIRRLGQEGTSHVRDLCPTQNRAGDPSSGPGPMGVRMHRATGPSQGTTHDGSEEQSMPIDEGKSTGLRKLISTQPVGPRQRDQHSAGPRGPDGRDPPRSCPPPPEPDRERPAVDASEGGARPLDAETRASLEAECFASQQLGKAEFDFDMTDQETHVAECNRLIRQFCKELKKAQIVLQPPKTKKRCVRCVLFEVMCSSQS